MRRVTLGHQARWEYFRTIYERYRGANRQEKQAILNEFCLNTGYHRKYAIRLLNGLRPAAGPQKRVRPRGRKPQYSPGVVSLLIRGLGSGGVSVVGAAESDPAELDAVDSPAVQAERGDGEAVAAHQRAADRPAVGGEEEPV